MTDGATVALIFGGLAAGLNLAAIVWRGSSITTTLKVMATTQDAALKEMKAAQDAALKEMKVAQDAAAAESKRQHEETRREIASLREDRVRAQAHAEAQGHRIERLEAEVERLRDSVHALLRREQGHAS